MAMTYGDRVGLMYERDRLRREREHENDYPIEDRIQAERKRQWEADYARKQIGKYRPAPQGEDEPRRSGVSVYSNVDQLNGLGRAPTVYEVGSDDDPTKEWTTAGLRQKAIRAQQMLDQFKAGKERQLQDAAESANADNEVLGRLYMSAFQTPRQLDADGRPMNTDMDANDIAQIVGNNPRFAGISRAGISMQDFGDGKKVPVLIYEKGGQMFMLDPNQVFAAANAFTGSQKATLSMIGGKGVGGAFGTTGGGERKPSAVDVANARGEQGFFSAALNTAMKSAIGEDPDGNSTFNRKVFDEAFDSAIAAYKRAFGGGETPAPTGTPTPSEMEVGAKDDTPHIPGEQSAQPQTAASDNAQIAIPQNVAAAAIAERERRAKDTTGTVDDSRPKYRGGQQQLDLLIDNGNGDGSYRRVTTNGYIGNDGRFYDGQGKAIEGVVGTFKTDYERDENGNIRRNEKGHPTKYIYKNHTFKDAKAAKGAEKANAQQAQANDKGQKQAEAANKPAEAAATDRKITDRQLNNERRKRNRFDFAKHYGVPDKVLDEYQRLFPEDNITRDNTKAAARIATLARNRGDTETEKKVRAALESDKARDNSIRLRAQGYANSRESDAHDKKFDALEAKVRDEITREAVGKDKDKAWIDREIVFRIDNGIRRYRRNAAATLGNAKPSDEELARAEREYNRDKAIDAREREAR